MPMFNTYEAKAKLSSLIKAALSGEEVIIANANNPSVKLVPYDLSTGNGFKFGVMRGEITISPDLMRRSQMMFFLYLKARRQREFIARHKYLITCFFFNDTATTEIYTLSQHDALPI